MRNVLVLAALCVALVNVPAFAQKSAPKKAVLKTTVDSVSYSIGAMIGTNLKQQTMEVDATLITRAIADVLDGKDLALNESQMEVVLKALQTRLADEQVAKIKEAGAANKKAGEQFLAQNKSRQGVVALPSGLQYEVITDGTGAQPKSTDKVTTHYKGTLIDGTTFDSSYERGQPASFQLDQVIRGWTEALQLMKVGSKWRLFVPSDLAYGEQGTQGKIGPNSALVFEVELLQVN
ncbi:MAG: FKBP-type peptidyl-prolyl cis-trans isomerase [bacterium]|nr:FKBP-type peptidyl-prolyl cis-trans isomerase [Candidatus Kapabacteria bacterium]